MADLTGRSRVSETSPLFGDVTGAILVGGRSKRLGHDKILLPLGGTPIFYRLHDLLKPLVHEIILVGHHRSEFDERGLRSVEDIVTGAGPLGGICTALVSAATPYVFVAAGDMPFLSTPLIKAILKARSEADAVVPHGPRGLEPLCAVYARSCAGPLRNSLGKGNRRIVSGLKGLKILTPDYPERDGEPDPFFNINYPEDLEKIR